MVHRGGATVLLRRTAGAASITATDGSAHCNPYLQRTKKDLSCPTSTVCVSSIARRTVVTRRTSAWVGLPVFQPPKQSLHRSCTIGFLSPFTYHVLCKSECCVRRRYSQSTTCMERHIDPPTDGTASDSTCSQRSVRSQFKLIPVQPSIFKYIQRIGVGIPKRNTNPNRRRRQQSRQGQHTGTSSTAMMSREEEQGSLSERLRRLPSVHPPPPFGGRPIRRKVIDNKEMRGTTNGGYPKATDATIVQALPVKIIGSVGVAPSSSSPSQRENDSAFPRPSAGIPEIAIAGRSNVGKSTLLNALLYGGSTGGSPPGGLAEEYEEPLKQRRRGKPSNSSSQTAQLPRGIKAATSSKPGETRRITFYQLSANVFHDDRVGMSSDSGDSSSKMKDRGGQIPKDGSKSNTQQTVQTTKKSLILVDLPGYGFAFGPTASSIRNKAGHDEPLPPSSSAPWQSLTERYLLDRPRSSLKRILLLIDARHGIKKADIEFLESLQNGLTAAARLNSDEDDPNGDGFQHTHYESSTTSANKRAPPKKEKYHHTLPPIQVVLTKCDVVPQAELARRVLLVRQQLSDCLRRQPSALPEMFVSAQTEGRAGVLELQKELASLIP